MCEKEDGEWATVSSENVQRGPAAARGEGGGGAEFHHVLFLHHHFHRQFGKYTESESRSMHSIDSMHSIEDQLNFIPS